MTLNIPNLNKLIMHLEAQPPERINMGFVAVRERPECGTAGCIAGHARLLGSEGIRDWLGLTSEGACSLIEPTGWAGEQFGVQRYPAHRVIATLKRLRDRFMVTGEIVVDWGPEPTAGEPWVAPQAIELTPPALPDEITRLLGSKVEA
ncbi:hypothetical protein MKK88_05635 [Methylobacterium sp. E-005]|uniref:hypothetical protein n=1 Tax=Methylobacterium sp. E-005 TaxID=2836549 RepID=UPI001FBA5950|nr:hypothetical protein [Methylobacterium sp. E-005]MCJ2085476.1 hypothetical protein [Methylobacterium sp. E-005]